MHKGKGIILISTLFYLVSCNEKLNGNQFPNRNQGNQQKESISTENDQRNIPKNKDDKKVEINNVRLESGSLLRFNRYLRFTIENIGESPITEEDKLRYSMQISSETGIEKKEPIIIELKKIKSFKSSKNTVKGNLIEPGGIEEFTLPVILSSETKKQLKKIGALVFKLEVLSSTDEGSKVIGSNIVRHDEMIDNGHYRRGYFPGLLWAVLIVWLFFTII